MDCVFSANVVQTVLSLHWLCVAIILGSGHAHGGEGAALIGATVCGQPAGRKGACFLRARVEKQSIQAIASCIKGVFCVWGGGESKHSPTGHNEGDILSSTVFFFSLKQKLMLLFFFFLHVS